MPLFSYRGVIPASKSIMNRCLVVASFEPRLELLGESSCDDVVRMRGALADLEAGRAIGCGAAGTVFRFLAFRASRGRGRYVLTGTERLLSRPQQAVIDVLRQLGVRAFLNDREFVIEGEGWRPPSGPILVDRSKSSQFATGLVLSAWDLDFSLELAWQSGEPRVSEGYWEMTLALVRALGMHVEVGDRGLLIPAGQKVLARRFRAETDLSSAFAVAAMAAVAGQATFLEFPDESESLQPDAIFVRIVERMGVRVRRASGELTIERAGGLRAVDVDLKDAPDLFPVLAILCALAEGTSRLYGAPQLVYKESDRIKKCAELIEKMGRRCESIPDGLVIHGQSVEETQVSREFEFDTDQDHRLAFAAAVARVAGFRVSIQGPEVVSKSFPEFWDVANNSLSNQ